MAEAIELIKKESGTQFDPELIEFLDEVKLEWRKIYKEYNENLTEFETLFVLT